MPIGAARDWLPRPPAGVVPSGACPPPLPIMDPLRAGTGWIIAYCDCVAFASLANNRMAGGWCEPCLAGLRSGESWMAARRRGCRGVCAILLALGLVLPAHADEAGIVIAITGGKFVPSEVAVPAGRKVKLIVRNQDNSMSEFESTELQREKTVAPGSEITVFVGPLEPGSYEFFDDFHPKNRGHLLVK